MTIITWSRRRVSFTCKHGTEFSSDLNANIAESAGNETYHGSSLPWLRIHSLVPTAVVWGRNVITNCAFIYWHKLTVLAVVMVNKTTSLKANFNILHVKLKIQTKLLLHWKKIKGSTNTLPSEHTDGQTDREILVTSCPTVKQGRDLGPQHQCWLTSPWLLRWPPWQHIHTEITLHLQFH